MNSSKNDSGFVTNTYVWKFSNILPNFEPQNFQNKLIALLYDHKLKYYDNYKLIVVCE